MANGLADILSAAYRGNTPAEQPLVMPPGPEGWWQGPKLQPQYGLNLDDWLKAQTQPAPSMPPAGAPPSLDLLRGMNDAFSAPRANGVPRLTPEQLDVIQGKPVQRKGQNERLKTRQGYEI